jgi:predicted NAD-dependent protein-ADP-ribosyltransferase YbiA (DUF1768 family)
MSSIKDSEFPYDETKQNQIKTFFNHIATKKEKKKDKVFYKRNPENGNLEIYDKKTGDIISSIPLYYYRSITKEEIEIMERERKEGIIILEEQIDIQKALLRKAYTEFKSTKDSGTVLQINNEIRNLELKKSYLRSPVRNTKIVESIETRNIDYDKEFEIRKAYDIQFTVYRNFPLWKLYGRYTDSKEIIDTVEQEKVVLQTGELFLKNGKIARIFNDIDNDNKNLSIFMQREFVYNDVRYSSPYQAFEAIRLMELGYEDLRNDILKTRGTRLIKNIGKKINKPLRDTRIVWRDILLNFYQQHEDLLNELLNTGSNILVFGNSIPYLGGVGINAGDDAILDNTMWKRVKYDSIILEPNIVGTVLMDLRTDFKESDKRDLVKHQGSFTESSRTKKEEDTARKGAIISSMKKRANY